MPADEEDREFVEAGVHLVKVADQLGVEDTRDVVGV